MANVNHNTHDHHHGLLNAFVFQPHQQAYQISTEAIPDWLSNPDKPKDAFLWMHFNLSHQSSLRWIKTHIQLSDGFYDLLNEEGSSTRLEQADQQLFALVNDVRYDGFAIEPSEIATLWACATDQMLITLRRKPLRTVDQLRYSVQKGESYRSTAELLTQIFRHQADMLIHIIRNLSAQVDQIEDTILTGKLSTKRNQLGTHRRTLVRLQRLLAPEPSALFRLINRPPHWVIESDIHDLRQATEEFSTVMRDMSGLQERIKLLQEEIAALIIEQTNRSLFILTGFTVIALPINMIAGLFGMNVGGIPLAESEHGFWLIVWMVATISGFVGWLGFNRSQQLR